VKGHADVFLQEREHGHVRKRFCRIGVGACPPEAVKDVCAVFPAHAADDLNRAPYVAEPSTRWLKIKTNIGVERERLRQP
jgi:hypothetical protein